MFDLSGKTALVCGGAGYLGLPVSTGLAEQGADVIIADYNAEAAEKAAGEISAEFSGVKASWIRMNVSDEKSVRTALERCAGENAPPGIMVNLAAAGSGLGVEEIQSRDFARSLHINLTGNFLLARESAKYMEGGGSIILYSSMYARVAPDPRIYEPPMKPNPLDYGIAKAGIEQMVRYLAVAWAPGNIRVNGICPGPFPNAGKPAYANDPGFKEFIERISKKVPLGRVGRREETAGAAVFLASDEASFVTGHTLVVDGGWTCL